MSRVGGNGGNGYGNDTNLAAVDAAEGGGNSRRSLGVDVAADAVNLALNPVGSLLGGLFGGGGGGGGLIGGAVGAISKMF